MSAQNLHSANWVRAQGTNLSAKGQVTTSSAVLHAIVGSHTGGSFRLGNGTLTSQTYYMGTFIPAAGPINAPFYELEFANGIYLEVGGSVNLTVIYNDLV